jgi:hypothetical protein
MFNPLEDFLHMLCGIVQGDADEPWTKFRLGTQCADPLFFGAVQFLQPRDDLPHVRAGGERGTSIMGRSSEHYPRVLKLLNAFDDESVE